MLINRATTSRRLRQRILASAVAGLVLVGLATPAQAASFGWSFHGECCIYSRSFTTTKTSSVWVDVDSVTPNGDEINGPLQYEFYLWRERGAIDTMVGSFRRGTGESDFVWTNLPPATYYFHMKIMKPWRDVRYWRMSGNVAYDGSRT